MLSIIRLRVVQFLAAIAAAAAAAAAVPPHAVTDDLGATVRAKAAPLRIISLAPGATEMLFAAGAGAQLVATVEYSDEPRRRARWRASATLRPSTWSAWWRSSRTWSCSGPAGGNPAQRDKIAALGIRALPAAGTEARRSRPVTAPPGRARGHTGGRGACGPSAIEARIAALTRSYARGSRRGGRACCCRCGTGRSTRSAASS